MQIVANATQTFQVNAKLGLITVGSIKLWGHIFLQCLLCILESLTWLICYPYFHVKSKIVMYLLARKYN